MNTNQDTTLTNQDEFNDFIVSDDWMEIRAISENSDELAENVWQAATKASEQRIKELDSKIQQFIGLTDDQVTKILELQAHINKLREALNNADDFITNGIEFGFIRMPDDDLKGIDSAHDTPEIIRKALSSIPSQSLAEHDNELLDKVIKILSDNGIFGDGIIGQDILKLKVTL